MPLIKKPSKKAFEHNIKAEMHAGKPQDQSLAIAYSVKRKAKKKAAGGSVQSGSEDMNMAKGGQVPSAKSEKRPMPDSSGQEQVSRNSGNKAPHNDHVLDQPTVQQAQSNNGRAVKPIKRPRMVPSDAFSTRLRDEEDHLMSSADPGPYGEQPPEHDNEEGPDRQGPKVRDMQSEHSTGRKPYAKGGKVEQSDYSARPNKYMDDLLDLDPSHDEGASMAESHDEESSNRQGPSVRKDPIHSDNLNEYAEGGSVEGEREIMHADSIAAAIMAKRDRMHAAIDSGAHDMDEAVRMAEGGRVPSDEISSHDSIYSDDSDQADLSRNADEDANEEDQLSFNALTKENYSESDGLRKLNQPEDSNRMGDDREDSESDPHDMVSSISRKIAARRQFKSR